MQRKGPTSFNSGALLTFFSPLVERVDEYVDCMIVCCGGVLNLYNCYSAM